jgi:hypothetical protein
VSKRLAEGYHIGAFVGTSHGFGDTTGVDVTSQKPSYGGFMGYSEQDDGSGLQARIALGYQSGSATFSRSNILGAAETSSGTSTFNAGAVSATIGRGYAVDGAALVTPYLGLTLSSATRNGYAEGSEEAGVLDAQFSYDAYKAVQITGVLGFKLDGNASEKLTYHVGAAVERDLKYDLDAFTLRGDFGSSSYVSGIAPRENRLNVSAGLGYLVGENSTMTLNGFISQHSKDANVDYKVIAGYLVKF